MRSVVDVEKGKGDAFQTKKEKEARLSDAIRKLSQKRCWKIELHGVVKCQDRQNLLCHI